MSYQLSQSYSAGASLEGDGLPPVRGATTTVSDQPAKTPGAWYVYCGYCFLIALSNLLVTICFALVALNAEEYAAHRADGLSPEQWQTFGWVISGMAFIFACGYAIGPFSRQGAAGWVLGLVLIGFGMTSLCTIPFSIYLLIAWFRPQMKEHFGMKSKPAYPEMEY